MASTRDPLPLAYAILDDLPIERSGKIAGDQLDLLARYPTLEGLKRMIRRLEKPEWWLDWPFYDKLFTKLVVKVGADARPPLEAAIKRNLSGESAHVRKTQVGRMKKARMALNKKARTR
jgi:hypothetical protein